MNILILSGGSGTRLWPLSREFFPKQYMKIPQLDNKSLFQLTFERAMQITKAEEIFVMTNESQKFLVMGEIEELGIDYPEKNIILEPERRDTLPAITLGMQQIIDEALILPSDHLIKNPEVLIEALEEASRLSKNSLVTFGITPKFPHTGYGYIKYSINDVKEFKEKPDKETAEKYIQQGYLWNSGIFYFKKSTFLKELKMAQPKLYNLFNQEDLRNIYSETPKISLDFGILEKADKISIIPLNLEWSDLGSFDALHRSFEKDIKDNVIADNVIFYDANNNYVHSSKKKKVAVHGIKGIIAIDTDDALLICKRDESEKIKTIVSDLKKEKDERADYHKTVYRPWGSFTILDEGSNYKVKRLTVLPGKILSLQKHKQRSEHWVVIKGQAYVVNGDKEMQLKENESTYIPKETIHRLGNTSKEIMEIIETQTGDYLGEDDIMRYEDRYGR